MNTDLPLVLVVDDEPINIRLINFLVEQQGLGQTVACDDPRNALAMLASRKFDMVLLDLHMPWLSGRELLGEMNRDHPDVPVLIMTAEDKVETAVACIREGAFDFLVKPLDQNRLLPAMRNALAMGELRREVQARSARSSQNANLQNPQAFAHIVTRSPAMHAIFSYIEAIGPSPRGVLITGESGTGKELVARAIHNCSGRGGAFVPINVSGLDDMVFSDSLFGHVRGAYTGAEGNRKGLVDQARDGTLFLDEIGDLAPSPQIKLLRLLQEGEYYPLGSDSTQRSKARVVTATNADLEQKQADGSFRRDLYYRLISHHIQLPPLRERMEDIPLLLAHFADEACGSMGKTLNSIDPRIAQRLKGFSFPGNVRELQAMVYDAVSRMRNATLEPAAFFRDSPVEIAVADHKEEKGASQPEPPVHSQIPDPPAAHTEPDGQAGLIRGPADIWLGKELPTIEAVEDFLYTVALERTGGTQQAAARLLGVSQSTLSRWIREKSGRKSHRPEL